MALNPDRDFGNAQQDVARLMIMDDLPEDRSAYIMATLALSGNGGMHNADRQRKFNRLVDTAFDLFTDEAAPTKLVPPPDEALVATINAYRQSRPPFHGDVAKLLLAMTVDHGSRPTSFDRVGHEAHHAVVNSSGQSSEINGPPSFKARDRF